MSGSRRRARRLSRRDPWAAIYGPAGILILVEMRHGEGRSYELNGSTLTDVTDKSRNGHACVQATESRQPTFDATSAPNSFPAIVMDDGDDRIHTQDVLGIEAGDRISFYTLQAMGGITTDTQTATGIIQTGGFATRAHSGASDVAGAENYFRVMHFETGTDESGTVMSAPALDTSYHLHELHWDASAASHLIDGASVTAAPSNGNGTEAMGVAMIGHSSIAGGELTLYLITTLATANQRVRTRELVDSLYATSIAA